MADAKPVEAIFLGACVVDLISHAERFPAPGETVVGSDFFMGHGGKGANSCVMAVRMGLRCGMIAKLGSDKIGKDYLQYLRDAGVNTDHVKIAEEKSNNATANIIVTKSGQNSIVYVHGAAAFLTPEDVKKAENMFKTAKLLVALHECSKVVLLEALRMARKYKVTTYVNAAPFDSTMTDDVYRFTDIICVNETEAEMITGEAVGVSESAGKATGMKMQLKDALQRAAEALLAKGCKTVLITLGERGACFCTEASRKLTFVTIDKVTVEDTTGAGDAFNGAFAYHYVRHRDSPLADMVKKACDIATITVQSPGTQLSYPDRSDIPARLL